MFVDHLKQNVGGCIHAATAHRYGILASWEHPPSNLVQHHSLRYYRVLLHFNPSRLFPACFLLFRRTYTAYLPAAPLLHRNPLVGSCQCNTNNPAADFCKSSLTGHASSRHTHPQNTSTWHKRASIGYLHARSGPYRLGRSNCIWPQSCATWTKDLEHGCDNGCDNGNACRLIYQ